MLLFHEGIIACFVCCAGFGELIGSIGFRKGGDAFWTGRDGYYSLL